MRPRPAFEGGRRDGDLLPGDVVQGLVGAGLVALDHEDDVAAAGEHPLGQVRQGVQGIDGQADAGQVHPVDDRADDGGLVCLAVHAALGGVEPGVVPEEPQVLGRFLAVDLGAAAGFAVGAQAAQRGDVAGVAVGHGGEYRVPGGDRDTAEGRAGRELRPAAGDGRRAGRDRGRGGLPLLPGGFACLLSPQLAGSPGLPGGLASLGALLCGPCRGGVPAASPGTGPRTRRPARPRARTAGHRPGHDLSGRRAAGSSSPTGRRGPLPACQRAAQRSEHPLRAARRPLPGRGERVASGQPRGYRDRDHARQAEPHAPRVPRVRQARQPLPQRAANARIRREHLSSSDRLDGQRSHLPDGDISNPCPTGAPLHITGTTCRNPPDSPLLSRRASQVPLAGTRHACPGPARRRPPRPSATRRHPWTPVT